VLQTLPSPQESILLPGGVLLNVRGLYLPSAVGNNLVDQLWPLSLIVLLAIPFVWRLRRRGFPIGPNALLLLPVAIVLSLRVSTASTDLHCTAST
jgi:general L-amino acid transport system permease protein